MFNEYIYGNTSGGYDGLEIWLNFFIFMVISAKQYIFNWQKMT
jgi:hypothetical protein